MELGYTPKNLEAIIIKHELSKKQVAEITGTANPDSVYRWTSPISTKQHADMPYEKWCKLLEFLKINPNEGSYMKVKLIDTDNPQVRRVISGSLVDILDLDYRKPLKALQTDVSIAIKELEQRQTFFKKLIMFGFRDVQVVIGNNHLQIVDNGKPKGLGWLFIGDYLIPTENN